MKKINRTYIMGIVCLALAAFIAWQTTMIPERLVSNEPGPKMFPFRSVRPARLCRSARPVRLCRLCRPVHDL